MLVERYFSAMSSKQKKVEERQEVPRYYDLQTPLLDKFYREARKRLRFPRYYKKAMNW